MNGSVTSQYQLPSLWYVLTIPFRLSWFFVKLFFRIVYTIIKAPFVIVGLIVKAIFCALFAIFAGLLHLQSRVTRKAVNKTVTFAHSVRDLSRTALRNPKEFPSDLKDALADARTQIILFLLVALLSFLIIKYDLLRKLKNFSWFIYGLIAGAFKLIWRFCIRYIKNLILVALEELLYFFAPWIPFGIRAVRILFRPLASAAEVFIEPAQTAWRRIIYHPFVRPVLSLFGLVRNRGVYADESLGSTLRPGRPIPAGDEDYGRGPTPRPPLPRGGGFNRPSAPEGPSPDANPLLVEDRLVCVVCQDQERSVLLNPCRHFCLCKTCADLIFDHERLCPVCRHYIRNLITDIYI